MTDIVIFYSRTGKTKLVSEIISKELNTEIVEIKEDTNRSGLIGLITGTVDNILNTDVEIKPETIDLTSYDTIYIGSPVWASKPAPAIYKFIKQSNFENKKVVTFTTMSETGGKNAVEFMNRLIKDNGGKVIRSFSIYTNPRNSIEDLTKEAIKEGE